MKILKFILRTAAPIILLFLFVVIFTIYHEGKGFGFGKTEYAQTAAECVGVGFQEKKAARQRANGTTEYETEYYAVYRFTFTVDGTEYEAENREFLCQNDDYAEYQEKKRQAQEDIGTTKTIYYNPENPEYNSFTFQNYDEVKSFSKLFTLFGGLIIFVVLVPFFLILIPVLLLQNHRRKKRDAAILSAQKGSGFKGRG